MTAITNLVAELLIRAVTAVIELGLRGDISAGSQVPNAPQVTASYLVFSAMICCNRLPRTTCWC
jgi:hypothetical protein